MENLTNYLVELSDKLDKSGKLACADAVDNLIKTASLQKIAQYVGAIGYVLKQNRAMMNCLRKKRMASNEPMQKVILDCLREYQDGQDYHDTEWTSKYAQVLKTAPSTFETAHITLAKSIFETNDLSTHIGEIKKVGQILKNNNVEDQVINKVLEHVEALHSVLKEEDPTLPFKVASPRSQRPWWRRIFAPSERHWWAPTSWTRRGEDEDSILETKSVRDNITEITSTARLMKDQIVDVRDNIAGMISPETDPNIRSLLDIVNKINPDNAESTFRAANTLQGRLSNIGYNDPISKSLFQLVNFIQHGRAKISNHFSNIWMNMDNLSQNPSVMGRNPRAKERDTATPLNELALLKRSLNALRYNIFDPKAEESVNLAFGLFYDRMRRAPEGTATSDNRQKIYNWLGESRPYQPVPTEQSTDTTKVQEISSKIINLLINNPRLNNTETFGAMGSLMRTIGQSLSDPQLKNMFEAVASQVSKGVSTQPQTPTRSSPAQPANPQPGVGVARSAVDPSTKTVANPASGSHEKEQWEIRRLQDAVVEEIRRAKGATNQGTTAQSSLIYNGKISLVKLADTVDEISPEVAEVVDKYIEEHGDMVELVQVPQIGKIIKEDISS